MELVDMKCEIFLQREIYLVSGKRAFARAYELRDFFSPLRGMHKYFKCQRHAWTVTRTSC